MNQGFEQYCSKPGSAADKDARKNHKLTTRNVLVQPKKHDLVEHNFSQALRIKIPLKF